jgi:hypothetical protein
MTFNHENHKVGPNLFPKNAIRALNMKLSQLSLFHDVKKEANENEKVEFLNSQDLDVVSGRNENSD